VAQQAMPPDATTSAEHHPSTMELQDKVCLIAGSSGAIGHAVAERFAREGAHLALTYLTRLPADLERLCIGGNRILPMQLDITDQEAIGKATDAICKRFGKIDCLVNCSGVLGPVGTTGEVDAKDWVRAIQVNLIGSFYLTRAVLPSMQGQGQGKIIHFSGGGAAYARPFYTAYSASKAALVRFCESLAEELRDAHIDVNAVAPGPVNSRMWEQVRSLPEPDDRTAAELQRMEATGGVPPERAADLAVFLASDRSNGLSGRLISAIWDEWSTLHHRIPELMKTEAGTLRRVPFV
jgi:NAD(P)-dependent dehydrogenase (short-subunit alcohol dehydrogenase family)